MSDETQNKEFETKEQLYILYLEIKGKLTRKDIEMDKDQFDDFVKNVQISTLINYIKELINILFEQKNEKEKNININKLSTNNVENNLYQLENHIKKLEYDIRHYIKKEFQNKIQKCALEMKLGSYMEIENEYEELKEKVKYEGGKFLNNERKDNEIIILRQENTILKKEKAKSEEENKKKELIIKGNQDIIQNLKNQIMNLTKRISKLEINDNTNTNNSSINININNNGNSSSKWIIKQEPEERTSSTNTNGAIKKNINNFKKNNSKYTYNLNLGKFNNDIHKNINGIETRKNRNKNRGITTIDNNVFSTTYNKIFNNLYLRGNKTPSKKNSQHKKNNSISMRIEDYDKYLSNKAIKYKSGAKSYGYNKIIGIMPKTNFPLSSKNKSLNKKSKKSLPKKLNKRDRNKSSHSSLNIRGNSKEYLY